MDTLTDSHPTYDDIFQSLTGFMQELRKMTLATVDYSVQGLPQLSHVILQSRAYAERALSIQAEAYRLQAAARLLTKRTQDVHQDAHDLAVKSESTKLSYLSWEERASLYRLKTMETLRPAREAMELLTFVEALIQSIESMVRSVTGNHRYFESIINLARIEGSLSHGT